MLLAEISNRKHLQKSNNCLKFHLNPLSAKLTKWPNILKKFVGNLPTNCLSVFGHFMGLALKGLKIICNYISSELSFQNSLLPYFRRKLKSIHSRQIEVKKLYSTPNTQLNFCDFIVTSRCNL